MDEERFLGGWTRSKLAALIAQFPPQSQALFVQRSSGSIVTLMLNDNAQAIYSLCNTASIAQFSE